MSWWPASRYCPLPTTADGWFSPMSTNQKWAATYPLLVVVANSTTCPDQVLCLEDFHLCSFGFSFLVEAISAGCLFCIAFVFLVRLQLLFPRSHHHRKTLFVLLALVGGVRGVYNGMASVKVQQATTFFDTIAIIPWFLKTNVPVNAVSDLLVAFVDFFLSFFWLDVMHPKAMRSRVGLVLQGSLFVVTATALAVTLSLDYHDVIILQQYNHGNAYYRSLAFLVGLLLVSGLLHIVVVCLLLHSMFNLTRELSVFVDLKLRYHVLLVAIIGFVSAVCLTVRAAVLLGRVARVDEYVNGKLSFDNPTFTTVYYVVMMNLPCIVVAVAFALMTQKLIQDDARELEDNHTMKDDLLLRSTERLDLGTPTHSSRGVFNHSMSAVPGTPPGSARGSSSAVAGAGGGRPTAMRVGPRAPIVVVSQQPQRRTFARPSSVASHLSQMSSSPSEVLAASEAADSPRAAL